VERGTLAWEGKSGDGGGTFRDGKGDIGMGEGGMRIGDMGRGGERGTLAWGWEIWGMEEGNLGMGKVI
jgi:hypothetical protein